MQHRHLAPLVQRFPCVKLLPALFIASLGALTACQSATVKPVATATPVDSATPVQDATPAAQARNVILFLGDGMGVSTVTAARIFAGQQRGGSGEEYQLSFERFPQVALSKTYNIDQQVPDSAGTMSAIMTGIKTRAGVISVQAEPARGNCAQSRDHGATTLLEMAELSGMRTGVISTARLTHATPAATYAHAAERGWEDDSALSNEAKQNGCADIARQLIEFPFGDGLELALGGGRRGFLPTTTNDPEYPDARGWRKDGRDLTNEWQNNRAGARYVWNKRQFEQAMASDGPVLGLFEPSHMQYEHDRRDDNQGEPSLAEMTRAAINKLSRGANSSSSGFFLMVEAGRIDHAHHGGNAYRALSETVALSDAVAAAVNATNAAETLIIVTADHSHVFTIAGYPHRGNPILGLVRGHDGDDHADAEPRTAHDGQPYTTLGYANGPGFRAEGRGELSDATTANPDFLQPAGISMESETHGGEDVAVYAQGPGAQRVHGVMEQNQIFFAMAHSHPRLHALLQAIRRSQGWPTDPQQALSVQSQ